ncbi:hypothetical protein APHAL10511_008008 [Amanita phalloides]|nr:hypothetical protein APHAL10511_008008 [Amanita phalloides]
MSSSPPPPTPTVAPTSYALTSLLDSLHTHLQQQTQLLPTLHTQLGLPPTAIEDELKSLQQQLVEGIERQIDIRRKEVSVWVDKCELVESECVRYAQALGGNTKVTGVSAAELKREVVLPRRYEMAAAHQEKLRQVGGIAFGLVSCLMRWIQLYHTKLEQLTTLTNRLSGLLRTLGADYFSRDILEPTPAIGEPQNDPRANRDVTPERFLKLERELVRGKAEVSKRANQLCATFIQIDWLYAELGMEPPDPDELLSPIPQPEFFSDRRYNATASTSALSVSALGDPFLDATPTPLARSRSRSRTPLLFDPQGQSESDFRRTLKKFIARLEGLDDEALCKQVLEPQRQSHGSSVQPPPIGLEGVEPTPGLLSWAENLRALLEDTKKRREAHIQAMYDQLEGLWRRMGISDEDMDAFVDAHRGSTDETIREYEEELERMLELKREKMGAFVASAREEIIKLWDELMVGEEERGCFAPFADDEHTEELLTIHEDEIRRLKEERRIKAPLLASIKKYFEICEEEKELAAAASDQSRLLGRGSRDPGRLLREEKMRKRVSKEKPRLERDLLSSIPLWEQEAGRPFLVHGESIMQIIMETVSAQDQENTTRRGKQSSRSGSVPPRSTTPSGTGASQVHASGTRTGVVTPAVRPATSMGTRSMSNKRQRIGDPHSGTYVNMGGSHAQRAPLGAYRGGNMAATGRSGSPSKIPTKTSGSAMKQVLIAMPIPKLGTQHHVLGHGRLPIGRGSAHPTRSISSSVVNYGRYATGPSMVTLENTGRRSLRARRESFKPRPSIDKVVSGRWTGGYRSVREEYEGD